MVKHGNWNAYQKTDEELQKEEMERVGNRVGGVMRVARQMFEILETSELNTEGRACAVEILGSMFRRIDNGK